MSKRGIALTLICSVALLAACTDTPAPTALEVDDVENTAFSKTTPPWAKNWGEPLDGGYSDFQADPSCMGENLWALGTWVLYGKVKETPSGNVITNGKVWWDPEDNKYINMDTGEVWSLVGQSQTWNFYTLHHADGVIYQYANSVERWQSDLTGAKAKGHVQVEIWILPYEPFFEINFKKYDYKCH